MKVKSPITVSLFVATALLLTFFQNCSKINAVDLQADSAIGKMSSGSVAIAADANTGDQLPVKIDDAATMVGSQGASSPPSSPAVANGNGENPRHSSNSGSGETSSTASTPPPPAPTPKAPSDPVSPTPTPVVMAPPTAPAPAPDMPSSPQPLVVKVPEALPPAPTTPSAEPETQVIQQPNVDLVKDCGLDLKTINKVIDVAQFKGRDVVLDVIDGKTLLHCSDDRVVLKSLTIGAAKGRLIMCGVKVDKLNVSRGRLEVLHSEVKEIGDHKGVIIKDAQSILPSGF